MGSSETRRKRTGTKAASSRKQKPLGKAAMRSMRKNNEAITRFFRALKKGIAPPYMLAVVVKELGDAQFDVMSGYEEMRVRLSGPLTGRGGFHHNPNVPTAVHVGTDVLVSGGMIVGVLSSKEARYAHTLMAHKSSSSSKNSRKSSNSIFNI
jgi:hypothetical protein